MSNAPIVKDVVKAARSVVGDTDAPMAGQQLATAQAAERSKSQESTAERRQRAAEAQSSGRMRAARGRGRGYRSLLSQSRTEDQQGKGSKTTLGG